MSFAFINLKDSKNTGDIQSSPYLHFNFEDAKHFNFSNRHISKINQDIIIIGGGGIISDSFGFINLIEKLLNLNKKTILWGAGSNNTNQRNFNWCSKDILKRFDLIGVRDYNQQAYPYLPCVSCMSPLFDYKNTIKRHILVYSHFGHIIRFGREKRIFNNGKFEKVIEEMSSSEIIITNSYHGIYWSMLLGKKTICLNPFSTRFYSTKYQPIFANNNNIKEIVNSMENYNLPYNNEEYLIECRNLNSNFRKKIDEIF